MADHVVERKIVPAARDIQSAARTKNNLKPHLKDCRVIPPKASAANVAPLEEFSTLIRGRQIRLARPRNAR